MADDSRAFARTTPRVIYRGDPGSYRTIRLADLRWVPAHEETSFTFPDSREVKRKRPDLVRIFPSAGTIRDVLPANLGDYVRRPTAKALARIEAAELAIAAANAELAAARRAAFTYGKPVSVAAVKATDKARASGSHSTNANTED